jgi:hypothetical protein
MALGALSEDLDRGDLNESIGCEVAPLGASYTKTWTALMPVTGYGCAAGGPRCRCCPPPRDRGRLDRRADRGRIRQDPRARAHGYRVLPALPPGRPRGTAPWLDPALAGCRGARLLAPSATLEVALKTWSGVLSETSYRRSTRRAETMAPHLPSVASAPSPLTWCCCGRPKTAAAEHLYVSQTIRIPHPRRPPVAGPHHQLLEPHSDHCFPGSRALRPRCKAVLRRNGARAVVRACRVSRTTPPAGRHSCRSSPTPRCRT